MNGGTSIGMTSEDRQDSHLSKETIIIEDLSGSDTQYLLNVTAASASARPQNAQNPITGTAIPGNDQKQHTKTGLSTPLSRQKSTRFPNLAINPITRPAHASTSFAPSTINQSINQSINQHILLSSIHPSRRNPRTRHQYPHPHPSTSLPPFIHPISIRQTDTHTLSLFSSHIVYVNNKHKRNEPID